MERVEIYSTMYDYEGYALQSFRNKSAKSEDLEVLIASPGGDALLGFSYHDALKERGQQYKTTTKAVGLVASAATLVFLGGKERIMRPNSWLMIHNPYLYWASGDAEDLENSAEMLRKMEQASIDIYVNSSNLSEKEVRKMMKAETWITAKEALSYGFATSIEDFDAPSFTAEQVLSASQQEFINVPMALVKNEGFISRIVSKTVSALKAHFTPEPAVKEETVSSEEEQAVLSDPIKEENMENQNAELEAIKAQMLEMQSELAKAKAEIERKEMSPVHTEAAPKPTTPNKNVSSQGFTAMANFVKNKING